MNDRGYEHYLTKKQYIDLLSYVLIDYITDDVEYWHPEDLNYATMNAIRAMNSVLDWYSRHWTVNGYLTYNDVWPPKESNE